MEFHFLKRLQWRIDSEFENYLTVNDGLRNVANKFGMQKVQIS